MNTCPHCGALINNGDTICSVCGSYIIPNQTPYQEYSEPVNYNDQTFGQTNYDLNSQNTEINNDILIDTYIGKNVDKIKNRNFSIWALLFGPFYTWYRKLYKITIIWVILNIILTAVGTITKIGYISLIVLILNIVIAIRFKSIYLKKVNKSIEKIKSENKEKHSEDLISICSKKGSVTLIPVIIGIITLIFTIIILVTTIIFTGNDIDTAKDEELINTAKNAINAVKNDIAINGMDGYTFKTYDEDRLNSLLEKKLLTSPYGNEYKNISVKVIKNNDTYLYSVCLIDKEKNGFPYTNEQDLNIDSIYKENAPDDCEVVNNNGLNTQTNYQIVEKLTGNIPEEFIEDEEDSDYVIYRYISNDNKNNCSFFATALSKETYQTEKQMIESMINSAIEDQMQKPNYQITPKMINQNSWTSATTIRKENNQIYKDYYYTILKDNYYYGIMYTLNNNDKNCENLHKSIIDSIKFEN